MQGQRGASAGWTTEEDGSEWGWERTNLNVNSFLVCANSPSLCPIISSVI